MEGFAGELGIREVRTEDEDVRLEFAAESGHLNPAGTVHGGLLATLVDAAMGQAARAQAPDGQVPATTQLTLSYLSASHEGLLIARARVRKHGEHILLCDADVSQDGETVVQAVATFALL